MARNTKDFANGVIKAKLGKLLEEFKTNLLSSLCSQFYLLKAKKEEEEV